MSAIRRVVPAAATRGMRGLVYGETKYVWLGSQSVYLVVCTVPTRLRGNTFTIGRLHLSTFKH